MSVLDLTLVDQDLRGFVGGFVAGKYGYFVPHTNGRSVSSIYGPSRTITSGKVARVDLSDFSTVHIIDLPNSKRAQIPNKSDVDLQGFVHGFAAGDYGYFLPHFNGRTRSGKIARVHLENVHDVQMLNVEAEHPDLRGFGGGFAA